MRSASESVEFLESQKWYSPIYESNTDVPIRQEPTKTPFDHDFHDRLFSFVNNLRSALDMLSQEIASVHLVNYKESQIDFWNIYAKLSSEQERIKELIDTFQAEETFRYLNSLRNVCQHRRIPLIVALGKYASKRLESIRPTSVRSEAEVYLPSDLEIEPDESRNGGRVNLFSFMKRTYEEVEGFVLNVYDESIS